MPPGFGRSAFASRVSTSGTLSTFVGAAAIFVVLAGGAVAYSSSRSSSDVGGKAFDSFSRADTTATDDELTTSLGGSIMSEKRSWDLHLEGEPHNQTNLAPIAEEPMDPDLARFSEFFDAPDSPTRSTATEELSQYSIEDFVNEAERNLLGVRIRYPGQTMQSNDETESEDESEMSSALVLAPPSTLLPMFSSTANMPKSTSDAIVPVPRSSNLYQF
jgi:hypothetical protein